MNLLRGAIRTYAWGSRTAIAEFTGRQSPTAHPEAELWLGAHPGDPAHCQTDAGAVSLLEAITADPEGQLGGATRDRFGDALPFLAKVLAADEPLSLQAHPSAQQAVQGFELEDHLGIPVTAPTRNYRDRSHKPEIIVALGPFDALAGFRPAARTAEFMRALAVSDLDPFIMLLKDQSDADGLRADLCKRGSKRRIHHDKRHDRDRGRIEATFNYLKDFRRIATRYDTLARNDASTVALAAVIAFWCRTSPNPSPSDPNSFLSKLRPHHQVGEHKLRFRTERCYSIHSAARE